MPDQQVELLVKRPDQPERRVVLGSGVTLLGRAEDNDLVLPDIGVSRRHARVLVEPHGVFIEDMGSGNGTWFEGERITRRQVQDGDEILIDPFIIRFNFQPTLARPASRPPPQPPDAERPGAPRARLVVLRGQRLAATYPIPEEGLDLGRAEARDIVLFDPSASRRHARIVVQADGTWLEDCGSANGTWLNGQRVRRALLCDGDRIRIGSTEFRFEELAPLPTAIPQSAPPPPRPVVPAAQAAPPAVPARPHLTTGLLALAVAAMFLILAGTAGAWAAWRAGLFDWNHKLPSTTASTAAPASARATAAGAGSAPTSDQARAGSAPTSEKKQKVAALRAAAQRAYDQGRYLDAATRFYNVLRLAPGDPEAERMGFLACEFAALQSLRADVMNRTTPPSVKRTARRNALRLADRALAGRASLAEAREALEHARLYYPNDPEITVGLQAVDKALEQAAEEANDASLRQEARLLYEDALARLRAGDLVASIAGFRKVQEVDAGKRTHYWYDADDGIKTARARLKRKYREQRRMAQADLDAGRLPEARAKLVQLAKLDPFDPDIRANLAKVEAQLHTASRMLTDLARDLEATGQTTAARTLYEKSLKVALDPTDAAARDARARLKALGG